MAHKNYGAVSHNNTGYNNHSNTNDYHQSGYNNHAKYSDHHNGNYNNHTNYSQHRNYHAYPCYGNHSIYRQSGYNNWTNYSDHHDANYNNHTNYGDHHNSGGSGHTNTGYTNHVNTTTNNAPGNVSNVSKGSSVYYKDSINLTWTKATDTPAYPIETFSPTFQNGFGNWGGAWGPVKVWRTRDKTVYIRGLVSCTQFGVIFNLPAGWRPTGGHLIFGSQEATSHCRINILNNGNVELSGSKSSGRSWINLNLCFNADASGWKDIPLMNTWVNYDENNGWQKARYKVTDAGVTFVEGLIRSGPGGIVGQLPDGVGPSGRQIRHGDSTNEAFRLDFLDNGQIYVDLMGSSNGHTSITSCFLSKGRTDGWVNINLQNGWTNYTNGYSVARYNKLESGEVFVEGLINSGTTTDYIQIWDIPQIAPKTTNIMVCAIKAGTNKNGSFGNTEHYPDGKAAKIWNTASNWHSIVHNYIIDQPTQIQTISYYIDYCFKPIGGAYGEWTRIGTTTGTSYSYNLSSHSNGHIKFRVLSTDGVENGSSWIESPEVRVLKYTAPSSWGTQEKITASDFESLRLEINKLADAVGTATSSSAAVAGNLVTKAMITDFRDKIKLIGPQISKTAPADSNLDIIRKTDIDNLKNWLKGV